MVINGGLKMSNSDNKNYKVRSFVINKNVLAKLQLEANMKDRTLNWLVNHILERWVQKS